MQQECADRIGRLTVGSHLRVTDDLGQSAPIHAIVMSVADDGSWLTVRYDHNGKVARLSADALHHFALVSGKD